MASTWVPLHVVRSAFGVFTRKSRARVRRSCKRRSQTSTTAEQPDFTRDARADRDLWGTGLGPDTAMTAGPLPPAACPIWTLSNVAERQVNSLPGRSDAVLP
jgi:hypothetical protein